MAQKKNSKKDLEKRVVKLKKKVATLTSSLSKKQSELSRALSSVQKKLDKLRKKDAPGAGLASLGERQQELLQTTEGLRARLHDLEQTVSIVKRASDEFYARADALEARVAEAAYQAHDLPQGTGQADGSLQHSVELLRDRTQIVEDHLGRLSGAQESLELQIALLSREAEEATGLSPVQGARIDTGQHWIERANELAAQVQEVQHTVAKETHDAADLRARSERLEVSATEMLQAQRALRDRVDELEQLGQGLRQGDGPDDVPELARQIPELRTKCSLAEEATGKLSRRAAVLEASYESLVEKDARIASQLGAVEQRLSELAQQLGEPGSGPKSPLKIPQALEQQVALLSTDRSLNQARIDEVIKRFDALEKTGFNYTRHTDALADRITTLSEELRTLNAEGRLNDLDRRGDALEQALKEERERLDGLQQAEEALDRRLSSAIGDAEALEGRINGVSTGSGQLSEEVARLDGEFQEEAKKVQQQQELLQTHAARLEQQRQNLDDSAAGHKKANDGLNARLATLEDSRQPLQEAADGLRVQQVRQDHETQNLQQSLKRRTLLGLLMFLLTAGGLIYLLMRGPVVPQDLQLAMQARSSVDEKAVAAIADLEKDMGDLRLELSALGDSLVRVSRSVDEINAAAEPALPAQLSQITEKVETLSRQDQQQRQQSAELQQAQEKLQLENVELRKGQEQQQLESAELLKGQEKLQAELDRIAEEVKVLEQRAGKKPGAIAPAQTPTSSTPAPRQAPARIQATEGGAWAQARASRNYTLQMGGFHRPESLAWFIEQHGLGADSAVYHTQYQGRKWYVVFHGIYQTIGQAVAAASQLPPDLVAQRPWVRRIPKTGDLFQL